MSTAGATAEDRRAARAEARRSDILDAAEHVFTTKGYNEAGIADIAAELGIGHGTFYRYFENKSDIAVNVLERALLEIATALADEDPTASENVEQYRAQTLRIMQRMFALLDERPSVFVLMHVQSAAIDVAAHQRTFDLYSQYTAAFLQNGVDKGFLRQEMDVEITAQALVGLIFEGTRRAVIENAEPELWERWISAGVALMFDGVAA